jgi:hypothetical protein
MRLTLTRAGSRALAATGQPRVKLAFEFRDATGRAVLKVASLRLWQSGSSANAR